MRLAATRRWPDAGCLHRLSLTCGITGRVFNILAITINVGQILRRLIDLRANVLSKLIEVGG